MSKSGTTLIELLVVIAIIGLMFSLLLPAVQAARESANRTTCQSNLRQIGLALHAFHDVHHVFPASGWTMAGPGNRQGKFVGWRTLILPYIEQASLRRDYDLSLHWWEGRNLRLGSQSLGIYLCPSVAQRQPILSAVAKRPRPAMSFAPPLIPSDYEAIMGVQASVGPLYADPGANRCIMFRNSAVCMGGVIDGTSNTLIVVECAGRPLIFRGKTPRPDLSNDQGHGWIDSEGAFSLDGANADGSLQGRGRVLTPRAVNATNENEPYGFHPLGANCLFADGHVRLISSSVPLEVFAGLCTRAAGEAPSGDY